MEVRVDTFVESLSGARKLVNTAYVVMVALDENEHPMEVPGLAETPPCGELLIGSVFVWEREFA